MTHLLACLETTRRVRAVHTRNVGASSDERDALRWWFSDDSFSRIHWHHPPSLCRECRQRQSHCFSFSWSMTRWITNTLRWLTKFVQWMQAEAKPFWLFCFRRAWHIALVILRWLIVLVICRWLGEFVRVWWLIEFVMLSSWECGDSFSWWYSRHGY